MDRIKEVVKRKNTAWREWFRDRTEEKKEKLKKLEKAAKQIIHFEKKQQWHTFVSVFEENHRDNKKMFYAILRNKRKPKVEISKILSQEGKLEWTRNEYLQLWRNHFEKLLNSEEISQEGEYEEVNVSTNNNTVILDILDL